MVSVAMAVYNGSRYVEQQLESILRQLDSGDEICISIDPSEDGSEELLNQFAKTESRIHLSKGPGKGIIENFENAISMCGGDIIFLADQDDVWEADKVSFVKKCFDKTGAILVMHDVRIMDEQLEHVINDSFYRLKNSRRGIIKNIIRNSYMGCAMAFKRELIDYILPMPRDIAMHDQWIGLVAEKKGKVIFTSRKLGQYRRHGGNVSGLSHADFKSMLRWRIQIIKAIVRVK
ncbi:MAG: glycosyltransferase family 2 protein [Lachnospiraceae bacterium]|nr:glycosyltransferase family 2 protein [Lachnospiraceae bacterium]